MAAASAQANDQLLYRLFAPLLRHSISLIVPILLHHNSARSMAACASIVFACWVETCRICRRQRLPLVSRPQAGVPLCVIRNVTMKEITFFPCSDEKGGGARRCVSARSLSGHDQPSGSMLRAAQSRPYDPLISSLSRVGGAADASTTTPLRPGSVRLAARPAPTL